MADQIPRFNENNSPGVSNQVNTFNQNNTPGVSNHMLNMDANSSPGVANQVLRMITDLASQLQQQSAQQGQGVDFGSDNLVVRSQSRLRGSSSLGNDNFI
jgi:hypothetical protein